MTERMVDVKGRCPACGLHTLFVADGGYLTCSNVDCTRPDAAHELIGEVADARQHGAFTFCPQLVGHASMREFATKISQKQAAYADAVKANEARDAAVSALNRVTALHYQDGDHCAICTVDFGRLNAPWPCATIRALENKEPIT